VALTEEDSRWLAPRARQVVTVPNGVDLTPYHPSPVDGPVVFAASFTYDPNRDAAQRFVREVWLRVRALRSDARLQLVGRDASRALPDGDYPGVTVHPNVPAMEPYLRGAAIVIAPVSGGGGAQLKVTEALGAHRIVVVTPYSARSAPPGTIDAGSVVVSDWDTMPERLAALLSDSHHRHSCEQATGASVPTWEQSVAPLVEAIRGEVKQ
jgi:hypothetical protein